MNSRIVVVGSCNIDLSVYSHRLPLPGETLHGTKFVMGFGGKGANQCVAAAKLGAATTMVTKLGDDVFGRDYLETLRKNGVNTDYVRISKTSATGMAQITVADNGENQIVIAAGANHELSPSDVDAAADAIHAADVLIFQFETPIETTIHTLKLKGNGVSIVNAAPAIENPDPQLMKLCDVFCVNETEAGMIVRDNVQTVECASRAVGKLLDMGCNKVILTLGHQGAVFATQEDRTPVHVHSPKMKAVDTTGAGDMFIGALGYYLAYHKLLPLKEVVRRSCEVAAISVLRLGTQSSFPSREELPASLFQ
uniref:Ribokinase n=1 Tax=Timema poppense TaxID=170557 RepID=A0A7R9H6X8_TIMPO|nr:unnamed protein product [Timema poppensis]